MKEFIYFPSFDSGVSSHAAKKDLKLEHSDLSFRLWSDSWGRYQCKSYLISAGHSYKKPDYRSTYGFDKDVLIMADSGGYQIASGAIKWDLNIRETIFNWLENNSDIAMNLDIPTFGVYAGKFNECLEISIDNFKYFCDKQSGKTKFLSVLQGQNYDKYRYWYEQVKDYKFQGWAVGGVKGHIPSLASSLCVLLENKEHLNLNNLYLHILGTSSVADILCLAQIQKSLNDVGSAMTLTTDSSTPSRATSYGYYYIGYDILSMKYKYVHIPRKDAWPDLSTLGVTSMPIMNDIDSMIWNEYDLDRYLNFTSDCYAWMVAHNFTIFQDCIRECNNYINNAPYILQQVVSRDMFKVLMAFDEMIKSDTPYSIFHKYLPLFEKVSRFIKKDISSEFDSNEFF